MKVPIVTIEPEGDPALNMPMDTAPTWVLQAVVNGVDFDSSEDSLSPQRIAIAGRLLRERAA